MSGRPSRVPARRRLVQPLSSGALGPAPEPEADPFDRVNAEDGIVPIQALDPMSQLATLAVRTSGITVADAGSGGT
jgi:hypothetical protein